MNRRRTRRQARRARGSGISLIEVLIAMGVLTLGLLGVAALFPVGGHYLIQGEVSDRADSLAEAALSDAIAAGMLDPDRWLAARPGQSTGPRTSTFDRRFGPFLRGVLAARADDLASGDEDVRMEAIRQTNLLAGSVFVIDPLGVSSVQQENDATSPAGSLPKGLVAQATGFVPASTDPLVGFGNNTGFAVAGWFPWGGASHPSVTTVASELQNPDPMVSATVPLVESWPVRRMTVSVGTTTFSTWPVTPTPAQARAMATADDDLSIELDDYQGNLFEANPDNPSQQWWSANAGVGALARQSRGDFSYCLTVVPRTYEARNGLAHDPESFSYDVSAVVFRKRVLGGAFEGPSSSDFYGHEDLMLSERQARVAVGSAGVGGGRLRLFDDAGELAAPAGAESPIEKLREGNWVMLLGPTPSSTSTRPLMFCQWYRVVAIESDDVADASLFVQGPDWPWQPGGNDAALQNATGLQNDLRLVIMPDVVAVHTRTLKLNPGAAWATD